MPHHIRAKKSLGQHFLKCRWVVRELTRASDLSPHDTVVEIGPGTGILTRALSQSCARVIAIEKDERLAHLLREELVLEKIKNVSVIEGDILKIFPALAKKFNLEPAAFKIVSNIPYYLTSRLLRLMLESWPHPSRASLTVQKEVAERICARPPKMNILALSVQAFSAPAVVRAVPAACFTPVPAVHSAIITLSNISGAYFTQNKLAQADFFEIIRAAFGMKRKILTNALAKFSDKLAVQAALDSLSKPHTTRAEELSLEEWARISALILKNKIL